MTIRNLPAPDLSKTSFLIIEDFEGMRAILRDILNRAGAGRIAQAASAGSAISMLEQTRYDVILSDLHLGHGKTGQDILEEARHRSLLAPHAVWLMVSSEKAAEMVTGTIESRPDDYLIKPITETMLFTRLSRQIAKKLALAPIETAMREHEYMKALRLADIQLEDKRAQTTHVWELKRLKAELAMHSGEHDMAKTIFEEALSQRELPWARLGLAKIHYNEGRYSDAQRELTEITAGNRAYLEAHDWLARTLDKLGDKEGAQAALERALKTSPRAPLRQLHLGEVAKQRGELATAARAFQNSIDLARNTPLKSSQAYLALSQTRLAQNDTNAALNTLSALAIDMRENASTSLLAHAMQIPIRLKNGERNLAEEIARELASELCSEARHLPAEAIFNLSESLLELGDTTTASTLLSSLVSNNHEHSEHLERAQAIYTAAGLENEGRDIVLSATRSATDIMNRGVKLSREGNLDEAIQLTREARKQMPNNVRLLLNHAFLLIAWMEKNGRETARNQEARDCIQIARKLKPEEKRTGELLTRLELIGHDLQV
jgi:tetratricopeptide (TPR) repeat protein